MQKTLLLVLGFTLAISHVSAQSGAPNREDELRGRIAAWNTAFSKKDITALTDLLSENFQFASGGGGCRGRDECAKGFERLLTNRPDLT